MDDPASEENIATVFQCLGLPDSDRQVVISALRALKSPDSVVNEYFDSEDAFRSKYSWNEDVFSSGRDGDAPTASNNPYPPFVIHPADDNSQVLYGTDPSYGPVAPSRPPSRATSRSPIGRLVDMQTDGFQHAEPKNKEEEDSQMQQAIAESRRAIASQDQQPPLSQMSGVTSGVDTNPKFGPANRDYYNEQYWSLVTTKSGHDTDPTANARKRNSDDPVFLSCRSDQWPHRIGPVLAIFHSIPAARNTLLRFGNQPESGYGSHPNWFRGSIISPPGQQADKEGQVSGGSYPPWHEEAHRLVAFLDNTERSYGTADTLAEAVVSTFCNEIDDREKAFFKRLWLQEISLGSNVFRILLSRQDAKGVTTESSCGCLELHLTEQQLIEANSLYDILDAVLLRDDEPTSIVDAPDVLTVQFKDKLLTGTTIPETIYIDKYLANNQHKMEHIRGERAELSNAQETLRKLEAQCARYTNPNGKSWDLKEMSAQGIARCQENITKIRNRAFWRDHERKRAEGSLGDDEFYLPDHPGDPALQPEEAEVIAHLEARIRQLETDIVGIDQIMKDQITPRREALNARSHRISSLLTGPSSDSEWNATHKYTLRGVVSDHQKCFVRRRETSLMELDENAVPDEQWWKVTCEEANGYIVTSEKTNYENVIYETFGIGMSPIMVYATDKAMDAMPLPLSEALKTFVRFDNRQFQKEVAQEQPDGQPEPWADNPQTFPDSVWSGIALKSKQSRDSMDSMATNQDSAGDVDEDMLDAPYEALDDNAGTEQHEVPELVDLSVRDSGPVQEMQEIGNSPLLPRPI